MSGKEILVVGEDPEPDEELDFEHQKMVLDDGTLIRAKEVDPSSGRQLRGYEPDLVVLTTDVDDHVRRQVIDPMLALDECELVDLS